jgi:hypothetical protein
MLDDNEREKIELEERYRFEIRNKLEENTKNRSPSRLWAFVNSSFGLWLLSAIFISGIGTIYTQVQNSRAERLKKEEVIRAEALKTKELIDRLDLEIGYRLSQVQIRLYSLRAVNDATLIGDVNKSLSRPPQGEFFSLYPEFSSFSLLALMAELRRHVPEKDRKELDQVLADLTGIDVLIEVEGVNRSSAEQVASLILKKFRLERWQKTQFYFLECLASSPFC